MGTMRSAWQCILYNMSVKTGLVIFFQGLLVYLSENDSVTSNWLANFCSAGAYFILPACTYPNFWESTAERMVPLDRQALSFVTRGLLVVRGLARRIYA